VCSLALSSSLELLLIAWESFSDQQIAAATQHPPDANKQPEKDPTTRSLQELQAEHRRNAMQARTLQKAAFKQTAGSGSLQVAVAKGASRQITVYLAPMTSSGTRTEASRILANATRSFPENMPMTGKFNSCLFVQPHYP
jgi:hypothetical protein